MKKGIILTLLLSLCTLTFANTAAKVEASQVVLGVVVDSSGAPLAGALLRVEGTNIGVGTTSKGEFRMELRSIEARSLSVRLIGYETQIFEVAATPTTTLNISMKESPYNVNDVVVTGSRMERELKDTPVITRVISAERIEQINPVDFTTLLQYELPGIQVGWSSMSGLQTITYQGMDSQYLVFLIDGERFAGEGADHNIDFNRINIDDIERIEVTRGAASTLYSSNALGGVVNIITKSATRPFSGNVSARYAGEDGQTYSASAGVNKSNFTSYTSFSYRQRDSYVVADDEPVTTTTIDPTTGQETESQGSTTYSSSIWGYTIYDVSQKFGYKFTDKLSVDLKGTFYNNQRALKTGEKNYDVFRDLAITPTLKYIINDKNQLNFSYVFDKYDKIEDYISDEATDLTIYTNKLHIARAAYSGLFDKHSVSAGVELEQESLLHYMMADSGRVNRTQISMYLQEDWKACSKANVVVGLRGDYQEEYGFYATPKVSLLYRPVDKLTIRANYAMGYRSPSLKELYQEYDMGGFGWFTIYGNPDLTPEVSTQYSLSAEFNNNKGLNASLSAYHNSFKDKISMQYTDDGLNYIYLNTDDAETFGVEVMASYRTTNGWSMMGSYSYINDYEALDGYNVSSVRPHSAIFNCTYSHKFGKVTTSATLNGQWQGKHDKYSRSMVYDEDDVDQENGYYQYSYYTYGNRFMTSANLGAKFPRGINASVMLNNLLNYQDSAYEAGTQTPQTGIGVVATISINIADLFKL